MGKISTNKMSWAFSFCNLFFKMSKTMKRWRDKKTVHIPDPTTEIRANIPGPTTEIQANIPSPTTEIRANIPGHTTEIRANFPGLINQLNYRTSLAISLQ